MTFLPANTAFHLTDPCSLSLPQLDGVYREAKRYQRMKPARSLPPPCIVQHSRRPRPVKKAKGSRFNYDRYGEYSDGMWDSDGSW
jgi:hypothetical protein